MDSLLVTLAVSLALTLALETLMGCILGLRSLRELALLWLVNLVTNPPVVLTYVLLSSAVECPALVIQLPLEAGVVLVEGCLYRLRSNMRRPLLYSLIINAFSYGVGILINIITGGM